MHPFEDEDEDFVPPDDQKTLEWITVLAASSLDYRLSHQAAG